MTCPSSEALSQTGTGPTTNLCFGHAEATILQKMLLFSLHHLESPGNATFLSSSITEGRNLPYPERQNFAPSPRTRVLVMGETELSPLCNTLGFYNPLSPDSLCSELPTASPIPAQTCLHRSGVPPCWKTEFLALKFPKTRGDENPPSSPFHQKWGTVWLVRRGDVEHFPRGGRGWYPAGEAVWG